MRILAFDHFFKQDLDAIRGSLLPDDSIDVIDYRRLHLMAERHLPAVAFDSLDGWQDEALVARWNRYVARAVDLTEWLIAAYRPSVFVVPNDTFFYLRPMIEAFQRRGVPVVCVQKETTIAPLTMDHDSTVIRESAPPIADLMTVCSERHREFAIRCGAPPQQVVVTGQPRFDIYASGVREPADHDIPPTLLYLSFDDLAYLPTNAEQSGLGTWRPLRAAIESILVDVAREKTWRVIAKTHPQQMALDDELGDAVVRTPRDADTRELILQADAVLGFQTTALFEAAVANRPILYVAWGPVFQEIQSQLIPFHEEPDLVTHVTSPERLRDLLHHSPEQLPRPGPMARRLAEEHLGPVDGHATERVLALVRSVAADPSTMLYLTPRRRRVRARTAGVGAQLLGPVIPVIRRVRGDRTAERVSRRVQSWRQERRELDLLTRS